MSTNEPDRSSHDDNPSTYQCGGPPRSADEAEMNRRIRTLKMDPLGAVQLGRDGVMRSFTADRDIIDAVGFSPAHIKAFFERKSPELRKRFGEADYLGPDGNVVVDGTVVPREQMYDWAGGSKPPPLPEEIRQKYRDMMARKENNTTQQQNEEADNEK